MSHPVLDSKDMRSYEHARQQHLHPVDRHTSSLSSSYRGKRFTGNSCKPWINCSQAGAKWIPSPNADDMYADEMDTLDGFMSEDPSLVCQICPPGSDFHAVHAASLSQPSPMRLEDCVRPTRTRKGIARDYELVPRPRQVMIVDDSAQTSGHQHSSSEASTSDSDDAFDWEILDNPGHRPVTRRTYAAVARPGR